MPPQERLPGAPGATGVSTTSEKSPGGGCLLRLFWMALGNGLLLLCAALISKQKPWTFSVLDAAYWGVAVLLLASRFVDIQHFHGETTDGKPATMAHLRRYAALLAVVSCAVWVLAHSFSM